MKKYFVLLLLSGAALLGACSKDATPKPSTNVDDPFARVDNPNSDADHQIYTFYQQTGIPVLYSDTLTKSPLTLLKVGYHITSFDSSVTYTQLQDPADVIAGLDFFKANILPSLGEGLRPYSVLLVDSLYTYVNAYPAPVKQQLNSYLALQAMVLGHVNQIKNLVPDSIIAYRKDVFKPFLDTKLTADTMVLKDFFAVSNLYYNKYAYGTDLTISYVPLQAKENYGLLSNGTESPYGYSVGGRSDDLDQFLNVVLVLTPDQFNAKYNTYPLVMTKYQLLLKAFASIHFILPQ